MLYYKVLLGRLPKYPLGAASRFGYESVLHEY